MDDYTFKIIAIVSLFIIVVLLLAVIIKHKEIQALFRNSRHFKYLQYEQRVIKTPLINNFLRSALSNEMSILMNQNNFKAPKKIKDQILLDNQEFNLKINHLSQYYDVDREAYQYLVKTLNALAKKVKMGTHVFEDVKSYTKYIDQTVESMVKNIDNKDVILELQDLIKKELFSFDIKAIEIFDCEAIKHTYLL